MIFDSNQSSNSIGFVSKSIAKNEEIFLFKKSELNTKTIAEADQGQGQGQTQGQGQGRGQGQKADQGQGQGEVQGPDEGEGQEPVQNSFDAADESDLSSSDPPLNADLSPMNGSMSSPIAEDQLDDSKFCRNFFQFFSNFVPF